MDFKKLQNGSDIRGVALEGIAGQAVYLTPEAAVRIGKGFAKWLLTEKGLSAPRICVGRDSRISGPALCQSLSCGLAAAGAQVTHFGLASTPAMFMATVTGENPFDASVMVTASHLPFNRNGFKFFTEAGGLEKGDIAKILEYAQEATDEADTLLSFETLDFMPTYGKLLADKIRTAAGRGDKPLSGLKVVVDAGNGAGGFFVSQVLEPLGADTTGSCFLEPDGMFPGHIPNPEDKTAMQSIRSAVLSAKADLGIIFDTDVDRAGAVLCDGSELNRNRLIAILSAILLRDHPGTTIVTDSVTSTGLARFIADLGGIHLRFKRGYKNVIGKAVLLNSAGQDAQLAMETSGHGALKENYFLDDGAYLMVKLLTELARSQDGASLSALIADLKEPAEAAEFRMNILAEDFAAYGQKVLEELTAYAEKREGWQIAPDNHEGIRVYAENGWFLLRMSLHDPLLPLNIESDEAGGNLRIARQLWDFLQTQTQLDLSSLEAFLA